MAKLTGVKTIDMVGGEITKVEYDGELYAKVEFPAREGDLAKANRDGYDITSGCFYIVEGASLSGFDFFDDENSEHIWDFDGTFTFYRKVTTQPTSLESRVETLETKVAALEGAEQKEEPLKVGDYAKVVGDYGDGSHFIEIGTIVKITDIDSDYIRYPIEAEYLSGKDTDRLFHKSDLVKATDEEVAEAKAKEAEIKRWAAIGRKPNEFKVGDAIRYKKSFTTVTVAKPGLIRINQSNNLEKEISVQTSDLTLVFPAEAKFE